MHLSTLLPFPATALLASANPALLPFPPLFPAGPQGSIVSTALATAPILSAAAPVVASAVAAFPAAPNNTSADSIPGLDAPPAQLFDNILDVVLTLLSSPGMADGQVVKIRDLDLPILGSADLGVQGGLGATITTLLGVAVPLLATELD
ncbi:MAG: hypothetical protein ALECFALPRED_001090 [Alectoria fallacina]|uniref:Uncharacterized protein n=1 Tax=Alectoria fallacina TaxID=1903189 RepID=A0A8H3IML9_9LECA|nr:MAG: hypothetical protein ALECFALPRED_001090 [Alectoria fallacina]